MSWPIRMIAPLVILVALALSNVSTAAVSRAALGRELVNRYLSDLQRQDVADLRIFLSRGFQVQRADGTRTTKPQFLRNPTKIGSYNIRRMRVTSDANALLATYQIAVRNEVINGKPYATGYSPRMMVFVRGAKGWQVLGLANFNAPK